MDSAEFIELKIFACENFLKFTKGVKDLKGDILIEPGSLVYFFTNDFNYSQGILLKKVWFEIESFPAFIKFTVKERTISEVEDKINGFIKKLKEDLNKDKE
jgi:hypothetical protein